MSNIRKGAIDYKLFTGVGKSNPLLDPCSDVLPDGSVLEPMTADSLEKAQAYRLRQLARPLTQEEAKK